MAIKAKKGRRGRGRHNNCSTTVAVHPSYCTMDYLTRMYIVYGALLCFTVGSLIYFHYYFIIGTIDESAVVPEPVVEHQEYVPASCEKYIVEHAVELGYASEKNPKGCLIWKDPNATSAEIHKSLTSYSTELDAHTAAIKNFKPIPDLLKSIAKTGNHDVCATTRLHPDGLKALFPSNQLSLTDSGYVEPLTPPMRNNKVCDPGGSKHLMSLDYLVHDFEHMCRKLKPTSKRILIDMGASLSFHGADQPIITLLELYEKFGFEFDHIYGFEISFTDPKQVYGTLLPEKYFPTYHWINVGESIESNQVNSIAERQLLVESSTLKLLLHAMVVSI